MWIRKWLDKRSLLDILKDLFLVGISTSAMSTTFPLVRSSHCWYVRSGRIPASFHSRILFFNCLDICRASDTMECRRIRDSDFVPDMKCSLRLRYMYGEETWPSVSVVFVHSWIFFFIVDVHHNQCPFWWLGCSLKFAFSFHFCWWSFFW